MNKSNQISLDDYHFLNDIETGFTTPNPMNKTMDNLLNQRENTIDIDKKNGKILYILDTIYKSYIILIGTLLTIGLCVIIYLVISKK
jgi:hypothetical protein